MVTVLRWLVLFSAFLHNFFQRDESKKICVMFDRDFRKLTGVV